MKKIVEFIKNMILELKKRITLEKIKKNYKIILLIILTMFLFLGYSLGKTNHSREKFISDTQEILKSGDCGKLSKKVRLNGERVKANELEPLIKYYSESNRINTTIDKLMKLGETETFVLKDKKGIFGDDYYLDLKTYSLGVNTNYEEGIFCVNDKSYIESGENFEALIPGIYMLSGKLNSDYGSISESKEILLVDNEEITINFNAINVSITSKYTDAEVFINGEDSKKTVADIGTIGPLPADGSVTLSIEKEFPWGKITSEKVQVNDKPTISLDLNIGNEELENQLSGVTDKFYKGVFEALNNEDKDKMSNCTAEVKNKIYNILEKKYIIFKNEYTIEKVKIMNDKNEYYCDNNDTYRATVVVKVDYNVEKCLFGLNKTSNSKMFFTKLIYESGNWKIEDVENFNL